MDTTTTIQPWRRSRTPWVGLLTAFTLSLGVAACGSSGGSEGTATAKDGSGAATTDLAVQYAQCMRANGLTSFPDPENGTFKIKIVKGGELDPETAGYKAAADKCKSLEPAGMAAGNQSADQQEQVLKYSACMRKNGVTNFPDPVDGRLMITRDQVNLDSPEFKKASTACKDLAPDGGALPPGGPVNP